MIPAKPPGFFDCFKSLYYEKTYLPEVDLSDQELQKHLLANENAEAAAIAQKLISEPEVQQVLSEPLSYDLEKQVPQNNATLQKHGFKLLSLKPNLETGEKVPYYSVAEHNQLPDWVIKSGATRISKDKTPIAPFNDRHEMAHYSADESLLRIAMAERIRKVAQDAKIDVVVPKKKLVAYANSDQATDRNKKYCVICEKLDVLSAEETVEAIKAMTPKQQKKTAKEICTIIRKAGLVDTSFYNIRLTRGTKKLAIIDTEPTGLMVAKKSDQKGASVEKCARIGLYTLMVEAAKVERFSMASWAKVNAFADQVAKDYGEVVKPKLSKRKIILSILSLGLLPLINVIRAVAKAKLIKSLCTQVLTLTKKLGESIVHFAEQGQQKQNPLQEQQITEMIEAEAQRQYSKSIQELVDAGRQSELGAISTKAVLMFVKKQDFFINHIKQTVSLLTKLRAPMEDVVYKTKKDEQVWLAV